MILYINATVQKYNARIVQWNQNISLLPSRLGVRVPLRVQTLKLIIMCKYCEALTSDKMDAHGHKYRELLYAKYTSFDFPLEDVEMMSSILPPTPISRKRHAEDGLTSTIEVYVADDKRRIHHVWIPIKYCPVCGRDLSND